MKRSRGTAKIPPVLQLNLSEESHSSTTSIEPEVPRTIPHLDDIDGRISLQNQQHLPTESQNATSSAGHSCKHSRHTADQTQMICSEQQKMPHSTSSLANENVSESSVASYSSVLRIAPGKTKSVIGSVSQPQCHVVAGFVKTSRCCREKPSTSSLSPCFNENGKQDHKIASSSIVEPNSSRNGIQRRTCSISASDAAICNSRSDGKEDLRSHAYLIHEDGPAEACEPSAGKFAYPAQNVTLVLHPKNSSPKGQDVVEMRLNGDAHENKSTSSLQNATPRRKSRLPPQRRCYQRPRGAEKRFYCSECPDYFWTKRDCDRHFLRCHPERKLPFRCEKCSASYGTRSGKTKHMRRAHLNKSSEISRGQARVRKVNGTPRFFCYYEGCEKSYTESCNVYRHVEMEHLRIRYRCECGYEATTRHNLHVHQNKKTPCS